ncbi:hypothetical protein H0X48_05425 [Candidatus Dependentiae bacterium]|nr:hypothetical protein [Candidatus Dependentiae bacterium]
MKYVYYFFSSLPFLLSLSSSYSMDTTIADQAQIKITQLFPEPADLRTATKLTPQIKQYLASLQQEATLLVLQAYLLESFAKQTELQNKCLESEKAAFSFKPEAGICFDNTTLEYLEPTQNRAPLEQGILFLSESTEANILYLRHQQLFINKTIPLST